MADTLNNVMKIASKSMEATQTRMRISAENMANAKSADYVPKSVEFKVKLDKKDKVGVVESKKIHEHADRVKQVYDPGHPNANADGIVQLPDTNPITSLMDVQEAQQSFARQIKLYETATDMKQRLTQLMGR